MSKLNGETFNIEANNIEKLTELFPEVNTDGKIDFDKLKQILGDYVDDSDERYRFVWNGKGEALRLSQTPSMGTLRPAKEEGESKNWDDTENLYIEGDNLEVLKLLQKSYFNKVKMIYIDPPYNTGGDFVYKDNFKDSIQNYKKVTGQVDGEGNATTTNREYSGRYHTDWLNMMYPRLRLARNLLTDDGVIFISIDDNEIDNLRKICDEVFGEGNFVAKLPTIMNLKGNNDQFGFAGTHEYTVVYMKDIHAVPDLYGLPLSKEEQREYHLKDNKGYYKKGATLMRTGVAGAREERPKGYYPIYVSKDYQEMYLEQKSSDDIVVYPKTEDGKEMSWRRSKETLKKSVDEFVITKTRNGISFNRKQRLEHDMRKGKKAKSLLYKPSYSSGNGTNEVRDLLGERFFDNPKPKELIKDLLRVSTRDGIVLDFFSGSGTCAHAVMELNKEMGYEKKYIMVQLPEETDKKSEAYKAGYQNIAEIGKERIRRAGEKVKEELQEKYEAASDEEKKDMKHPDDLDIGFKVFKLDSSNIKEWNPGKYENIQGAIEDTVTPYVQGRTEEDVVYEMMLKMGLDLTYSVENYDVKDKTIYSIGYGFLMICLADEIDVSVAEKMIEIKDANDQQEFRAIFRDEGFTSDTDKTNVKETLRAAGLAEESFITL